jgi:hypothetical protein
MQDCLLNRNMLARIAGMSALPIILLGGVSAAATAGSTAMNDHRSWQKSASVADIDITGKVTGADGEGLPGANVLIKSTVRGTSADQNGNFKLTIQDTDAVLVFSLVGYVSKEVAIGSQKVINVMLVADNKTLEEVVVVGYGTQRKRDVTGSVVSVSESTLKRGAGTQPDQPIERTCRRGYHCQ